MKHIYLKNDTGLTLKYYDFYICKCGGEIFYYSVFKHYNKAGGIITEVHKDYTSEELWKNGIVLAAMDISE